MQRTRRYSRVREKLTDAVYRLATREGDVRERLIAAYVPLRQLSADELPDDLREVWESILRRLTRLGPGLYEGEPVADAVTHTMGHIRNSTGRTIAADVYGLYRSFLHAHGL